MSKQPGKLWKYLNAPVAIADDLHFGDFFTVLTQEADAVERIFAASLIGVPFVELIRDFQGPSSAPTVPLQAVELCWRAQLEAGYLSIVPSLRGRLSDTVEGESGKEESLAFIPVQRLSNCRLLLDESVEIFDALNVRNPHSLLPPCKKQFSLYDMVHAILFELTFYGAPETRDREGLEINSLIETASSIDDVFEIDMRMRALRLRVEEAFDKKIFD